MLKPADWLVVAAAAAVVGALAVALWAPAAAATHATVTGPDGSVRIDLSYGHSLVVEGFAGDSVIEVADGRVRFAAAPCRNRVCIAAGWLDDAGAFAACAPNGVSILVGGGNGDFDAIAH